ncbi:25.3 kDa vesicle transport protein SEC22-1-like isoform X3 [Quercus suber]|uniref:25.3 kDa vesicle transport protein SEC22-1-like isoform X3 n=1 Tax=Quercus suber TaxID=58331 RepID=UPI0032E05742
MGLKLKLLPDLIPSSNLKTKKLYQDTCTQRNIAKLNDELYEVHQIMTCNVQEVLGVGEKLDQVSEMSSRLTSEPCIYADNARDLNRQVSLIIQNLVYPHRRLLHQQNYHVPLCFKKLS